MALPELLELEPVCDWPACSVSIPGSKSITNRALALAALGPGRTVLRGGLWSEDTEVMTEALRCLGFRVDVGADPREPGNRTFTVDGAGGTIPEGGTVDAPLELHVGNAGTAARFLAAMVCLGRGVYRLSGVPRMHERPQSELFRALRALGYRIDAPSDRLPAVIHGGGPRPGRVSVSAAQSSQFASALLLCARVGGWDVEVAGGDTEELPYVEMTRALIRAFPAGGAFDIEPDASSASYFWAADILAGGGRVPAGRVKLVGTLDSGWQADAAFPRYFPLPARVSRATDLADSILTAMVLAPWAAGPVEFTELGRLRVQECERVLAMRTELGRCGVRVEESGDTLRIHPADGALRGADIETYGDHRMAMCFAVMGLRVPGIRLKDPACVRKTFPTFFAKLAAPAPLGLGVRLRDGFSGGGLGPERWMAD